MGHNTTLLSTSCHKSKVHEEVETYASDRTRLSKNSSLRTRCLSMGSARRISRSGTQGMNVTCAGGRWFGPLYSEYEGAERLSVSRNVQILSENFGRWLGGLRGEIREEKDLEASGEVDTECATVFAEV